VTIGRSLFLNLSASMAIPLAVATLPLRALLACSTHENQYRISLGRLTLEKKWPMFVALSSLFSDLRLKAR
jgi:hypothetical protein